MAYMRKMVNRAKFAEIGMHGNSLCHAVRDIAQEGCRLKKFWGQSKGTEWLAQNGSHRVKLLGV
jgi:hypothetical protein